MKKKYIIITLSFLVLIVAVVFRLQSFEISADESIDITFEYEGNKLAGTLYLPETSPPYNVAFFVHGDGPSNRSADGGYSFLMNHLLKEGIACFSYDKAGISESEGNWLSQSMLDRSLEVEAGLKVLEQKVSINKKGVIAFSQGGWVVSELAKNNASMDFIIVIGGAIDWMDQHLYYERKFAERNYTSENAIEEYLNYVKNVDEYIVNDDYKGYVDYVTKHDYEEAMSLQRFEFAYLNHGSNAREGIKAMDEPFLGIFGAEDLNVDINESYRVYDEIFKNMGKTNYDLHIFPNATHALLESQYQDNELKLFLDTFIRGKNIFVKDYFATISQWIMKLE